MRALHEIMVFLKEKKILWIMTVSLSKTRSCDVSRRSAFSPCATRNGVGAPHKVSEFY